MWLSSTASDSGCSFLGSSQSVGKGTWIIRFSFDCNHKRAGFHLVKTYTLTECITVHLLITECACSLFDCVHRFLGPVINTLSSSSCCPCEVVTSPPLTLVLQLSALLIFSSGKANSSFRAPPHRPPSLHPKHKVSPPLLPLEHRWCGSCLFQGSKFNVMQ